MVPHDDLGAAVIDHPLDHLQNLDLFRSAVDEIPDEYRLTLRMAIGPGAFVAVSHALEQIGQQRRAAVHVTDDVEPAHGLWAIRTR